MHGELAIHLTEFEDFRLPKNCITESTCYRRFYSTRKFRIQSVIFQLTGDRKKIRVIVHGGKIFKEDRVFLSDAFHRPLDTIFHFVLLSTKKKFRFNLRYLDICQKNTKNGEDTVTSLVLRTRNERTFAVELSLLY